MRQAIAVVLLCAAMAAGQEPIYTISPGQKVSCVVPDKSKDGWHFDLCKLTLITLPPRSVPAVPLLVPAVQDGTRLGWVCGGEPMAACMDGQVPVWKCADPSRIKLTAEDGTVWCLRTK